MVGACRCGSSSVKCLKRPSCRSRGRHYAAPVFAVITPDLPTVWEHPHAGVAGSTAPGTGTESAQLSQLVASLERLRPSAVDALTSRTRPRTDSRVTRAFDAKYGIHVSSGHPTTDTVMPQRLVPAL
jgi:hypothetical protein